MHALIANLKTLLVSKDSFETVNQEPTSFQSSQSFKSFKSLKTVNPIIGSQGLKIVNKVAKLIYSIQFATCSWSHFEALETLRYNASQTLLAVKSYANTCQESGLEPSKCSFCVSEIEFDNLLCHRLLDSLLDSLEYYLGETIGSMATLVNSFSLFDHSLVDKDPKEEQVLFQTLSKAVTVSGRFLSISEMMDHFIQLNSTHILLDQDELKRDHRLERKEFALKLESILDQESLNLNNEQMSDVVKNITFMIDSSEKIVSITKSILMQIRKPSGITLEWNEESFSLQESESLLHKYESFKERMHQSQSQQEQPSLEMTQTPISATTSIPDRNNSFLSPTSSLFPSQSLIQVHFTESVVKLLQQEHSSNLGLL